VMNSDGTFERRCNMGLVDIEPLQESEDVELVLRMLGDHLRYTKSTIAADLLADWSPTRFVKVIPRDYKRVLLAQAQALVETRATEESAVLAVANG
jgi:glutamate synthase domain-containing protein 3